MQHLSIDKRVKFNMESRTALVLGEDFEHIKEKVVTIVGIGGTGSTVANILCRLPFKKIILIDGDEVNTSNFERQLIFFKGDLNKNKAKSAYEHLKAFSNVDYYDNFINDNNSDVLKGSDLIIDCSDNFSIRNIIYEFCKENKVPWIYSGVIKGKGQLFFVKPENDAILKLISEKEEEFCSDVGVINAVVSLIGSWVANMAILYLAKGRIEEKLIRIDLTANELMKLEL